MKKLIVFCSVILASMAASAFVAPENYCKHDASRDTGICGIGSNGIAFCLTISGVTTNKDCYGVNND